MRLAFFILLIATKATQMTTAAQAIIKAQNKDTSARALRGENSEDDGVNPFVIGGETLNRTIWEESRRYLVDIRFNRTHSCGATKISDRVVLTAARKSNSTKKGCVSFFVLSHIRRNTNHPRPSLTSSIFLSSLDCFSVRNRNDWDPNESIQFNRYSQDDETETGVITVDLCQTEFRTGCDGLAYAVCHPEYDGESLQKDVALIFLPENRTREIANIPDVTLNCDPNVPVDGQELEVFGWGRICEDVGDKGDEDECDDDTKRPDKIQTGMLEYLTNQECMDLEKGITDDMLCVNTNSARGVAVGGGDSGMCNSLAWVILIMTKYDTISHGCLFFSSTLPTQNLTSGGPLVIGDTLQVGVVSFGSAGKFAIRDM